MSGKSSDDYKYRGHLWFAKRPGIGRLMEGMAPEYEAALNGWDGKSPSLAYHMFDKAHVVMLTEQGIIPKEDGVEILKAFRRMELEGVEAARTRVGGEDHSGEAYLIMELGWGVGGRIHVGRSTGDLRTTSMHIVQRNYILEAMKALLNSINAMIIFSEKHVDTITPMYSAGLTVYGSINLLQHAQVMTWGYCLMGYVNQLEREFTKLEAAYGLMQISPAGSAIGTGTDVPNFSRTRTMELQGFTDLYRNCFDAEKHEGYALDSYAVLLTLSNIISGLFFDLLIYSTHEFNLIEPADRYCGTSSIMPQKKNPMALRWMSDITVNVKARLLEARNEEGMQESWTDIINGLRMIPGFFETVRVNEERNLELAGEFWSGASDLAAAIMREKGLPWRTAHQIVSTLVRLAIDEKKTPKDVTSEFLDRAAVEYPDYGNPLGLSDELIQEAMDPREMVTRRTLIGGPAPVRVKEEIQRSRKLLEKNREKVNAMLKGLKEAEEKLEKAIDALIGC
ncbi:MAG: lyase family protein [Candidatus Bathyarchaeota archaeon]|nr:lyase family protein [Candidatus Bathyarchaeota archaeon]